MKMKQEKEMALLKSDMEVFKTQNNKYEEHIRKLSNQIVRLNDNILEYQKENAILSTKLKHMVENQEAEKFKRPNSIHVSTISSSTGHVGAPNIGSNLAMEDEEGEVFNNTYLTDMKEGRMSEFMSRDICAEELKYRNSLLPPHLKSSYAAQFDHDCPEDELKVSNLSHTNVNISNLSSSHIQQQHNHNHSAILPTRSQQQQQSHIELNNTKSKITPKYIKNNNHSTPLVKKAHPNICRILNAYK